MSKTRLNFMLILAVTLLTLTGCPPRRLPTGEPPSVSSQLVVLYDDDISDESKKRFKGFVSTRYDFRSIPCECNLDLEIWIGSNIENLLFDTSTVRGEPRPISRSGVTGDGDSVYFSRNITIGVPDKDSNILIKMPPIVSRKENQVKVAVLDTGLDTAFFEQKSYDDFLMDPKEIPFACFTEKRPGRYAGWNFLTNDNNFQDNYPAKHGTNITGLILAESTRNWIRILPLKTHNSNGIGVLFDLLCAMKFAEKAKVDYINASWGDYGTENIVFSKVLRSLENNNIVFITAAGNEGDDIGVPALNFYPACYSGTAPTSFTNVITTTTTDKQNNCNNNNFSKVHVDVGASGKHTDCMFRIPFQQNAGVLSPLKGSSFATAVMTGIISDRHPFSGAGSLKNNILNSLTPVHNAVGNIRTAKGFKQH